MKPCPEVRSSSCKDAEAFLELFEVGSSPQAVRGNIKATKRRKITAFSFCYLRYSRIRIFVKYILFYAAQLYHKE